MTTLVNPSPADSSGRTHSSAPIRMQWEQQDARELDALLPGSMDSVVIFTAVANTIMQLANPAVGRGVVESRVESGSQLHHPFKRTRTTLAYLAIAMHGSTDEKLAYRRAINRAHAQVHSTKASPVTYNAFDPELQLWVAACVYWGYVSAYEKFRGPLNAEQAQLLYRWAEPLATTLQVRPEMWPADVQAFDSYWQAGLKSLQLDPEVKDFLDEVMRFAHIGQPLRQWLSQLNTFMTAGFLPPVVRAQMQLEWSEQKQQRFERVTWAIGQVNRRLPRVLRQLPMNAIHWDFQRRLRRGLPLN